MINNLLSTSVYLDSSGYYGLCGQIPKRHKKPKKQRSKKPKN